MPWSYRVFKSRFEVPKSGGYQSKTESGVWI